MYYIIYCTHNDINGKIYIGKHKTSVIIDNYLGSGINISRAIKKYGTDNFHREILYIFDNEKDMNCKEKEIVTEKFCDRADNYNLCAGGQGGFSYINKNKLYFGKTDFEKSISRKKARIKVDKILEKKYGYDWRKIISKKGSILGIKKLKELKKGLFDPEIRKIGNEKSRTKNAIKNKKETFAKNNHQQGSKNSQYGTMWITNGQENKKIKKEELNNWISLGYYKGRIKI